MTILLKSFLFLLFAVLCEADMRMEASTPSLIKAAGYPVEKHRVITEDGYVLQMHRIPAGRRSASTKAKVKKTILIVHGLLGSSGDFVIMGPDRSLAYLLADADYDVWLGNLRGNVYTTHKNLTRNNREFWDYSFHEHGKYDVPAMIDKVLNITGLNKIMYVGYSMGTTSFFVMMALKPMYNDKIIAFVAMGPAVYLNNVRPIADLMMNTVKFPDMLRSMGIFALRPKMLQRLLATLCTPKRPKEDLCTDFIFFAVGEDFEQHDIEMAPIWMHRLQGASLRQLEHFWKIALTGVFTTWGGGLKAPVELYNLTNVHVPVLVLYGENDQLTVKSEILRLAEELKAAGSLEEARSACSWPKFNHMDFIFAKDVGELYNKPLILDIDRLYNKYK